MIENHEDQQDIKRMVSTNLLRLRVLNRYSQKQVAKELSIKQPSYNRMERGETRINVEQLYQLCIFYHISFAEFFKPIPSSQPSALHIKNSDKPEPSIC